MTTQTASTRLLLTRIPDSWAWVRTDILIRLVPFTAVYAIAYRISGGGGGWLGLGVGNVAAQLVFALIAAPVMFAAAAWVQLRLTRRRGALSVPAAAGDAWFQAAFYALNGPIEEAFFRGLMQGGIGHLWGPAVGFALATPIYVVYHRLGRWPWPDTFATALVGIPFGIAFWLLPGPASLLGVSLAHIGATCGFLGPGPYLLRKMRFI
ncbi:MAG TPA: CPBP family intramembrane glutamic endopeptidase [Candidatus Sulfotelmatobacter sp.]|nr:CPBP family intramembrane glutamic endopeptidase [Candidatus Sulfotelmatobacter sp.]